MYVMISSIENVQQIAIFAMSLKTRELWLYWWYCLDVIGIHFLEKTTKSVQKPKNCLYVCDDFTDRECTAKCNFCNNSEHLGSCGYIGDIVTEINSFSRKKYKICSAVGADKLFFVIVIIDVLPVYF